MSIELLCACGQRLRASEEQAGGQGRCPMCGRVFDIPAIGALDLPDGTDPERVELSTAVAEQPLSAPAHESAVTDRPPTLEPLPALPGVVERQLVFVRPGHSLFSTGQIGLAAFLGGPLAGFLLIARNYSKLGRRGAAWLTFLVGVVVAVAVVGSGFLVPDLPPGANCCVAVPLWLGIYAAGRVLQGPAIALYLRQGGARASSWGVIGYTVLGVALTIGPAIGAAFLYEEAFADRRLRVSPVEEVIYSWDVSEAEARQVAQALQGPGGVFDGVGDKAARLSKDQGEYVLSFFLEFGHDDWETQQQFRSYATLASEALGGKPVQLELCDVWMRPRAKLPAVRALRNGK